MDEFDPLLLSEECSSLALGAATAPILLTPAQLAHELGVSRREVYRMDEAGQLPCRVQIGPRKPRWRRAEILEWVEADCPDRETWATIRAQKGGRPCGRP